MGVDGGQAAGTGHGARARCCLAGKDQGQAGPRTSGRADPGGWSRAQSAFRRGRRGAGKVDRESRGVWCLEASKDPVAGEIRRISGISTGFRTPAGISAEPPSAQNATPCAHFAPCLSCCRSVAFRPEARFDAETNPRNVHTCATRRPKGRARNFRNFRRFSGRPRNFPRAAECTQRSTMCTICTLRNHCPSSTFGHGRDSARETNSRVAIFAPCGAATPDLEILDHRRQCVISVDRDAEGARRAPSLSRRSVSRLHSQRPRLDVSKRRPLYSWLIAIEAAV